MSRYKIKIEYDGTKYCGWQKQKDEKSIQEVLEKAIFQAFKEKVDVVASGRTDAGVHAKAQIAHFDLEKNLTDFQMMMAINQNIENEEDVSVIDCEIVDNEFNARFSAKMRHYQYIILNRRANLALDKNRVWHVPQNLDLEKMQEASKYLIGKHDFSSFRDSQCQAKTPIRTIQAIKIEQNDNFISFEISAKSFLHHMVRNIVGTLVMVGKGKINPKEMSVIIESKDRAKSGPNAPACGLYFLKVDY